MSYYKTIGGKRLDSRILALAEKSVSGARDGRISKKDAAGLVKATIDASKITEVEKTTLLYILKQYNWTPVAAAWFKTKVGKLKPTYYKTVGGKKMDGLILDAAAKAVKGSGDGRISKADAAKIFKASKDGGVITPIEVQTLAYLYYKFNWTPAAAAWFANQLEANKHLAKNR
jgi:hypothetical protein